MFMIRCAIKTPRCINISNRCSLQWCGILVHTSSLTSLPSSSSLPSSRCSIRPSSSLPSWSSRLLSNLERLLLADDNVVSAEQFLQNTGNSKADFVRLIERPSNSKCNNDGEVEGGGFGSSELQTALVSYHPSNNFPSFGSLLPRKPFLQVDLVSTIHIADKKYFETLQKELKPYDCVLYEMVVSRESLESTRNLKKLKGLGSCGFDTEESIQRRIASFLKLDFQLDSLDYQAENWFHADLDLETYDLLQHEKGEIPRDKMLRWTKAIVLATSIPEDLGPSTSRASYCAEMKVFIAKLLKSELTEVRTAEEGKSAINGERNKAAIEALRRAIDEGHKKISILYGVGHMPDLGRHLREEFDLVPSQVQWITAMSIRNYKLKTAQEMDLWLSELFSGTIINELSDVVFNHLSQSHGSEKLRELPPKHLEEQRKRKAIEPCSKTRAMMNALDNELSKIVGLNELKLQFHKWAKGMLLNERRRALGLKVGVRRPPHMAFLGNPGTGKTMVARVLGKLLHTVGILPTDKVTEVQRTDLVAEHVGETGQKTRKKIQQAAGGILFVDEAYRLMPVQQEHNIDYGLEALEEIMSVMDSGKVVVVFAGYSEPMKRVISSNEGFCRRVTKFFRFDDFSSEDLAKILHLKMTNQGESSLLYGFKLHPSCSVDAVAALIERETTEKQRKQMNGGLVDPMLVNARENLDLRLNFDCTDIDELVTLTLEDIEAGIRLLPQGEYTEYTDSIPPSE